MPLPAPLSARALLIAALLASLPAAGCSSTPQGTPPPSVPRVEGQVTPHEVPDADFAASVHRILRDGSSSAERLGLLVGVVRRQLSHASQRFGAGHEAQGTASVIGALYLVRVGEGRKEMIDAAGEKALGMAIDRLSPRGDEGRSLALMKMRAAALDPSSPAKAEIDQHLAALDQWMRDTRTGGPMRRLGAEERAMVARALLDPQEASLEAASNAVNAWISQAIRYNEDFRQTGKRPEREEAIEASRALESGGATMAALYLRYGDAKGALEHIDGTQAKRVIQPGLYARIRSAAVSDDGKARDWLALAAAFSREDADEADPETDLDPELMAAGLWGCSIEAYRRDPANLDGALLLARSLIRFGLPEVAPLVLSDALGPDAPPGALSAAMELLLGAIGRSAEIEDLDSARRAFHAGAGLLAQADRQQSKARVEPSPSRVRSVMAMIEIRAGNLAGARPLLKAALAQEPSASGFTTLAMVERQAGDRAAALAAVEQALRAPDARVALLDVTEAHVTAFELHRDASSTAQAKGSLDAALANAMVARQMGGNAATRARAERLLGRILEGYGESKGASRAFERALGLAGNDRSTLGAAMLDAIGRALVRRDLGAARAALKRGLDGDANDDDLVYGGLWVQLLEHELKATADGTVERALRAGSKTAWIGKLTAWASGKLSDSDLGAAAQNASQKVEAAFYTAMAKKVIGDPGADQKLRAVAQSPVIDLLEVQLARELLAPRVRADLPGNVQIP
jgi:tetratricopeptide (TPR) repeat protein